jgi:hypothetical protein
MSFSVYSIRLSQDVWLWRKFFRRNEDAAGAQAFYVGSTGVAVDDRVEAHMAGNPGRGGNDVVRRFANTTTGEVEVACLGTYATRAEAEAAEKAEASRLRRGGMGVWCNQKPRR